MKTVLFATDHIPPDPKALDYALVLCKRLAARLEVLHILQSSASVKVAERLRRPATRKAGQTMPPARGDQAPAHNRPPDPDGSLRKAAIDRLKRLLSDHPAIPIDYHFEIASETTGATLERYVRNHRDIVLTVFDPRSDRQPADIPSKTSHPAGKGAVPRLAIPLVLVKKTH